MTSNMKTVAIDEATLDQLKEFATNTLGLSYHHTANTTHMLSMIRQVHTKDTIQVADTDAQAAQTMQDPASLTQTQPSAGKEMNAVKSSKDPKVTIMIPLSEKEGGDRPVPVGVNGKQMLLPRGKDIVIPYRYYEALLNAVKTEHVQDPNDDQYEIKSREVPAYGFQVKRMPPDEEIKAWLKGA